MKRGGPSFTGMVPIAALGSALLALATLASVPAAVGQCKFECSLLGIAALGAAVARSIRHRHRGWSALLGACALASSIALLLSNLRLARDLRALDGLHRFALHACAAPTAPDEGRIVCDVGLPCDEGSKFQVSCGRDDRGAGSSARVFIIEGFDSAWVVEPDGSLQRY
ncbi:MAG: hypothetical protein NVSMB23_28260 [Myxococcales bacterium]